MIVFDEKSAKRIGKTVRRVERMPQEIDSKGRTHRNNSEGDSGTGIFDAQIKTVTDANIYTADIYYDRENVDADEEGVALYVRDIVDELVADDWIPVKASTKDGYDYENAQQLGAVG